MLFVKIGDRIVNLANVECIIVSEVSGPRIECAAKTIRLSNAEYMALVAYLDKNRLIAPIVPES